MSLVNELVAGMLRSKGGFQTVLRRILLEGLDMSVNEFCTQTGISTSTMYKILEDDREPNLKTVRAIVNAVRRMENAPEGNFIAVIASRPVLNTIEERVMSIGIDRVLVKEYPATTMEGAIISSVNAERDGALAVVCAPIVAPTIEKILSIPVTVIIPGDSLKRAIEVAARHL